MNPAKQQLKNLSSPKIDASPEIRAWLSQFPEVQRAAARLLLSHLQFVSRDAYAEWLRGAISSLPRGQIYALYSVRKLNVAQSCFWNESGEPVARPGASLGSEDLVYSLISNVVRSSSGALLDHPSLSELKNGKIHNYVLIDDSIGSGERVAGFINAMLQHPTFLSWWSFGWIKIHVLSFSRPREAEAKIISEIRGSDHGKRKFRKSDKLEFTSEMVYERNWYEARWGREYKSIIDLCEQRTEISRWECLGYGDVMANLVFYHSVPDNIPGMLWCCDSKWQGLMPNRAMPDWLLALLDSEIDGATTGNGVANEVLKLLELIKRGVRSTHSIALRLHVDHKYAVGLLLQAKSLGLVTSQNRLTATGLDHLRQSAQSVTLPSWDHSLYIPSSWCADRATVQPSTNEGLVSLRLTDSVEVSAFTDGDVGQTSLERSDARAATPPFSVMPHLPAVSRENHDTDGPLGSKDR